MTRHITNDCINLHNVASLIGILETVFGNPNKVATMERKLRNLWQANWNFSTYYIEFVCYAANTTWNEAAKWLQLEEGLYHELKNDLIARDEPKLFVDFISLLQKLDQKRCCLTASVPGRKAAPTAQQHMYPHTTHTQIHAPHIHTHAHCNTGVIAGVI